MYYCGTSLLIRTSEIIRTLLQSYYVITLILGCASYTCKNMYKTTFLKSLIGTFCAVCSLSGVHIVERLHCVVLCM